jgi:flagellar hook-associated protein FlgK
MNFSSIGKPAEEAGSPTNHGEESVKNVASFLLFGAVLVSGMSAHADERVGIKECDDYTDQYQACLNDKVPKEARESLAASLTQMRTAWKAAASNPASKDSLAQACVQAKQMAKTSMSAYGCNSF